MTEGLSMTEALLERIRHDCREAHEQVLALAETMTEEQLRMSPGPHAPSIAFHVWHLARWADHDAELFAGEAQIWRAQGLAAAWGFPGAGLGEDDTGTEMGDDAAGLLVFPDKAGLLDYARATLGRIDDLVDRITREAAAGGAEPGQVADLFGYMTHDNRHLGMIEALRGVMGLDGTATR